MIRSHELTVYKPFSIPKLIISLLIPLAIGLVSGYITRNQIDGAWFTNLQKSSFNPPNAVFGPVWTTLYILMGISLFLIRNTAQTPLRRESLLIFGLQLFFNFWWSILFFSFHALLLSIIDILLMWCSILYMIKLFHAIRPSAAYLQIPYMLWVTFAAALNISFYLLNK